MVSKVTGYLKLRARPHQGVLARDRVGWGRCPILWVPGRRPQRPVLYSRATDFIHLVFRWSPVWSAMRHGRRSTSLGSRDTLLPPANDSWRWTKRRCCRWRRNQRLIPSSQRCNLGERPSHHSSGFCSPSPQCSMFFLPAVCATHTRMPGGLV